MACLVWLPPMLHRHDSPADACSPRVLFLLAHLQVACLHGKAYGMQGSVLVLQAEKHATAGL